MKKSILLISNVEVIEVEDNGSNVIECVQQCHGDLFPVSPADMPTMRQMNREIEYAEVRTFTMYKDVSPEPSRLGTHIFKTEVKIAMTRDVQEKLGEPFQTVNRLERELKEEIGTHCMTLERLVKAKAACDGFSSYS